MFNSLNQQKSYDRSIVMMVTDSRIDRRVLDQARSLNKAGWKTTVIARPADENNTDDQSYPDVTKVRIERSQVEKNTGQVLNPPVIPPNVDISKVEALAQKLPNFNWSSKWSWFPRFLLEALRYPASVYTANDLPMLPCAAIAAHYYQSYLAYDMHEIYPEQKGFPPLDKRFYRRLDRWLAFWADLPITVNESAACWLEDHLKIDKPAVILNCPSFDAANLPIPKGRLFHDLFSLPNDKKIVLYQGGLVTKYRNLEMIIEAMPMVEDPNIVLVMMGPSAVLSDKTSVRELLTEMARDLGILNSRVFFADPVPQHELIYYSASADVGIIPYPQIDINSYYCTPNKLAEFIVAGLPIIANDSPELSRFVSCQGIGLNKPLIGPSSIASLINDFFNSDTKSFREKAMSISKNFVWEKQGQRVVEIYEGLIGGGQPPKSLFPELLEAETLIRRKHYSGAVTKINQLANKL